MKSQDETQDWRKTLFTPEFKAELERTKGDLWDKKNLHYAPGLAEELKRIGESIRLNRRMMEFAGMGDCLNCGHKREEDGVMRCRYSTVDLDPRGFCHRWEEQEH